MVSPNVQETLVGQHCVRVFQSVGVHEGDPLHQTHVVLLDPNGEGIYLCSEVFLKENLDVGRVDLRLLLWEAEGGQEVAWVDLQVVV